VVGGAATGGSVGDATGAMGARVGVGSVTGGSVGDATGAMGARVGVGSVTGESVGDATGAMGAWVGAVGDEQLPQLSTQASFAFVPSELSQLQRLLGSSPT